MKSALDMPEGQTHSIMQRIVDGTLSIDSTTEFREIIKIYPKDPFLLRKYADLLAEKKQLSESVQAYNKASALFINEGMTLQAIVSQILAWSIEKPSHQQGRMFHEQLHSKGTRQTPLQRFWAGMTYPQLVAVMLRMVRVRIASGKKVIECDTPANEVFFVVSGTLAEMPSELCVHEARRKGAEIEARLIGHNDIFGDVFPLDAPTLSVSDIKAITDVELIKIAKSILHDLCGKHPRIGQLLFGLYKTDDQDSCNRSWQTVRRTTRCGLPTKIDLAIQAPKEERHSCIAVDLSLGGLCADLGPGQENAEYPTKYKGKRVRLVLDLLDGMPSLKLMGKIVWHRRQTTGIGARNFIGIRFDPPGHDEKEKLINYCNGGSGEQDLLWALWDNLVRTDNSVENLP